jgi:peptidoglycan/LPS O-acetylase OafA/YrhL
MPAPPTSRQSHRPALDGVRGLAALGVLVFHVWLYRDDRPHGHRPALVDHVLYQANVGLIAFFVLSGFLLYRPYARAAVRRTAAPSAVDYARRRVARIVPAYYACGIVCVLAYSTIGPDTILPAANELPAFAVFAQNYSLSTLMQLNPVLWTLSVEAAFYVALPLVALMAIRLRTSRHALLLLVLVAFGIGFTVLDHAFIDSEIPGKTLPEYIGIFAIGMLVALALEHRNTSLTRISTAMCMLLGLAMVLLRATISESAWISDPLVRVALFAPLSAAGFGLVIAAAAEGRGRTIAWLRSRPLAYAGLVSYGLYLWHVPVILVLRERGALPSALAPRLLTVLAVTFAIATVSWRLVEKPVLDWVHGRRRRAQRLMQPAAEVA